MSKTANRIKECRREKGYSVDYIAEKMGINRATIYRYEDDRIEGIPYKNIIPLAKILDVDPAYLMGWKDIKTAFPVKKPKETNEILLPIERTLIEKFQSLPPDGKQALLEYADLLLIKYEQPEKREQSSI